MLVKIKGLAPDYGKVSISPQHFAVNFIYKEKLTLAIARAIGQRGKTPDGKDVDLFSDRPDSSGNLVMKEKGWEIVIWIAVEVPKDIDKFWIRLPSQIHEPVSNPKY